MGNIGSIISKKNGMFVSVDNNGNIRDAGVGNPITECSFIAAPNSIVNNINGTYYTPLSTYITDIIEYYIRPIYNILDPEPKMSIDGIDDKLTFNITNYSNKEISLNIVNITGNINYSNIKWYIKSIKETDNIQDIIDKSYNDNNNLDLPCKLKYTEGYTNTVIYNNQYFDNIILVYAKAEINRLDGTPGTCYDYVLLQCDTNQEMIKNDVYTFYYNKVSGTSLYTDIPNPPSTTPTDKPEVPTDPDQPTDSDESNTLQSPLPEPTLLPDCYYLSYGSYLYPDSFNGSIDLYTRSYPYSYSYLTISYNDNVNNIDVYSVINGTYTNIKNGDKVYNNDITDVIYSYNPNGTGYIVQSINRDLKNKIYISYCSYSHFKSTSESDTNFINQIQIKSNWGSKSENNSYSTYFNIYGDKIDYRPENTNGLSISCNYKLDSNSGNTYDIYIPYWTNTETPTTIEFTLNKDFGYNYDDKYYYQTPISTTVTTEKFTKPVGWVIYINKNLDTEFTNDGSGSNEYFRTPNVYGFDTNDNYNDFYNKGRFTNTILSGNNTPQFLYSFNYQIKNGSNVITSEVFKKNHNKVAIAINKIPNMDNMTYLPLTILFTTNTNKYKDSNDDNGYSKSEIYEVLKVNIYRNPTSTPVPTTTINPGIRV